MRLTVVIIIWLIPFFAISAEMEEGEDYVIFKCENYHLRIWKTRGSFDLLLKDSRGDFHSMHRSQGESPWFGYNGPKGEIRSSGNPPSKLDVKRTSDGFEVFLTTPLEENARHQGIFLVKDDFLLVRSTIQASRGGISIVRLAPRFEVDIDLFNQFAFSVPQGVIRGSVRELGRPSYAGVGGWGGPKSYSSLNPDVPFFALYNPEKRMGFLFLFPFYEKLWKDKHIFLQLWENETNYFYAGWGEEKDLGKEVMFAIAPLEVFSSDEILNRASELAKKIEKGVRSGEIPFPSLLKTLELDENLNRYEQIVRNYIDKLTSGIDTLPSVEINKLTEKIFEVQMLFLCTKSAYERGDYDTALSYSERMLEVLGLEEGRGN